LDVDLPKLFHQHVLIKAFVKDPPVKEAHLEKWLAELVADIKMKIVIQPRAYFVDTKGNEGLTGSVNIETSHIAIHVWSEDKPPMIQMDVYSCTCFENQTVLNKLNEFGLLSYELMHIDRNDGFKVVDHVKKVL
jgi:S-adenosylmethionine/arginine decarboxylase-like enzyme